MKRAHLSQLIAWNYVVPTVVRPAKLGMAVNAQGLTVGPCALPTANPSFARSKMLQTSHSLRSNERWTRLARCPSDLSYMEAERDKPSGLTNCALHDLSYSPIRTTTLPWPSSGGCVQGS